MNRSSVPSSSQLQQWASRLVADYDARQPGMMFAERVVLDVATAYQLQAEVAQLRQRRGERVIGYKVGCTSPTIRSQLGIDHCIMGRLYDSEQYASGVQLSRSAFAHLAIEGELAVELTREPRVSDFVPGDIPACVARVFPVIELHHHVMRGNNPTAGELIANNAIHAGFIAGEGVLSRHLPSVWTRDSASLTIWVDGGRVDQCAGEDLLQTVHSSLRWLTQAVRDRGERLGSGQIVLTGSIPSLIPVVHESRVRVDAPPFGHVDATFTA